MFFAPCGFTKGNIDHCGLDRVAATLVFERQANAGNSELLGAKPSAQLHDEPMCAEDGSIRVGLAPA